MTEGLDLVLALLAASVAAVALFRRFRLPAMLGYLSAGIVLGPHATGIVPEDAAALTLGDFGVVFLMFTVGLEFSLAELMAMRRTVFGLGGAQMTFTFAAIAALLVLGGVGWPAAVTLSGALALSSTAIVSRLLTERLELRSQHGQRIMGVALFQDLAVVPLLIVLPALGASGSHLSVALMWAAAKAVVLLALLLRLGRPVLARWFSVAARAKSSEIFVLNALLASLAMAWATEKAGLSLALGAFIAGALISETEYRYQVSDYIKPFRDVLLGLFFIGIGMLLNLGVVFAQLPWVLLVLVSLTLLKLGLTYGLTRLSGDNDSVSLRTALALAFCGEFGFVLLAQGEALHLLPSAQLQTALAAMLLSMLVSPFVMQASDRIVLHLCASEWTIRALALHELSTRALAADQHIIVCGFGRSGQTLVRLLENERLSVVALDLDAQRVRAAAAAGESVVFGDAGRREVLVAAGVQRASAVIISFAVTSVALRILGHVRELAPGVPVIVRTHDDADIEQLRAAGAAEVVPEILEGALMLASQTMLELGVPLATVLRGIRAARAERYQLMRGFFPGSGEAVEAGASLRLQSVLLPESARACGRTLAEVGLHELDVEVRTVRRPGAAELPLGPELRLVQNDVVVLQGNPAQLARAEMLLLGGG
ncbi:MAG: cation:proton antiporter [Pseudomonadota bacterium]|nr:cation:proton antiporter [Pseudomonadota bacterium]